MVCAKCEAAEKAQNKGTTLAVTDVWKSDSKDRNDRKIGGNKLLEAKKRYAAPVPKAGSALKKGAANSTGVGSSKRGAGSAGGAQPDQFGKCKICKVTVAKEGAKYCQKCAFKEGKCIMCEAQILDTSKYKMSAK